MSVGLFNKLLVEKSNDKDKLQKDLLKEIQEISGRKTIAYISNFKLHPHNMINFDDKSRITMLVDSIDTDMIDFILHSPGGFAEEIEVIVNILRRKFDHIRFIIPHSAKSAATMLALSGNEIIMHPSAELGPIDPQVQGVISAPAQAIIDGFNEIKNIVSKDGKLNGAYVPLLNKMDVATIKRCENAIKYGSKLVESWLISYMFKSDKNATEIAKRIAGYFSDHNNFLTHGKPITIGSIEKNPKIADLKIYNLKDIDEKFASKIWEYYCRFEMIMGPTSPVTKIFHSESEYMVSMAPVVELQNPIQKVKKPPVTPKEKIKKVG